MDDIVVIVGPTGVGKTKLSLLLAQKLNAEIINADSVSIYRKLDIGSAKPTKEEQEMAVHHLLDIRDVTSNYSIFDYQKDARKTIEDIRKKGRKIIIVGGTGLYIKAALYNYKFSEGTKNNNYDDLTNEEILKRIKEVKQDINIHVNNRVRLVRVLNKIDNNEEFGTEKDEALYKAKIVGLTTDRDILYKRIDERVDNMIKDGLLEEIEKLKPYYKDSKILNSAIGYKEFNDYLFNNGNLDDVIYNIKKNSRHYAKRQYTFFNHQLDVKWFDVNFNDFNTTYESVLNYLKKNE